MSKKQKINNNKDKSHEKIKIYVLGNTTVGKTSYIMKLTQDFFQEHYVPTLGFDFHSKNMKFSNGTTYMVNFYDTAGQERYHSLTLNIIRNCDGIILMYDVTDEKSFKSIPEWIKNINDNMNPNYPIILLGNKCDLEGGRNISKEQGEELSKKYGLSFFETSNKDGINIEDAWLELSKKIIIFKEQYSLLNEFIIIENKSFTLEEINEIKEINEYNSRRGSRLFIKKICG